MEEAPLVLAGPGDIVAATPYLLRAQPNDSVVIFPADPRLRRPFARADIPPSAGGDSAMARWLAEGYEQFAGGKAVVIAFTDQLERATSICDAVADALEPATAVIDRIAAQGDSWVRVGDARGNGIDDGTITQADRDRIAVAFIGRAGRSPYGSLDQMQASFESTGEDLSQAVVWAADRMSMAGGRGDRDAVAGEQRWMTHAIEGFVARPQRLSSEDAARLIGDVQRVALRDHALDLMTREEAAGHAALWKDLLTRSPEKARTPVANLAAFGAWLDGDGMGGRLALERATDPSDTLSPLIGQMLERGLDPAGWEQSTPGPMEGGRGAGESSGRHDPRRDPPSPQGHDRTGPAR